MISEVVSYIVKSKTLNSNDARMKVKKRRKFMGCLVVSISITKKFEANRRIYWLLLQNSHLLGSNVVSRFVPSVGQFHCCNIFDKSRFVLIIYILVHLMPVFGELFTTQFLVIDNSISSYCKFEYS